MQKKTFSHSPYFRISNILLSAFMIFLVGQIGYLLVRVVVSASRGAPLPESFVTLLAVFPLLLVNVIIYLNWQPDFVLQDDGIVVKIFHFWERTIPWEDVVEVKHPWIPITGKWIYVVVVRRLTPWHVVLGMVYGFTLKPAFVITRALGEREKAVNLIASQIAMRSSKVK
jgi:hypothetical protein